MVGMPYPNMNTPELKEKMSFLNTHVGMIDGKQAGTVFDGKQVGIIF